VVTFVVHRQSVPPDPRSVTSAAIVAIIPARYESTRLPGKPLAEIGGRPMIEHVYRRAAAARSIDAVMVATDHELVARAVEAFGGNVRMTRASHRSGSDRLGEVAEQLACEIIVNVQGDEPLIEPAMIDEAVAPFAADPRLEITTLRRRIEDPADYLDPDVVKVVTDRDGFALYFSRAPIPFVRNPLPRGQVACYKHIGLYVYRREALLRFARLAPTPLEEAESLEQLRALEHGFRLKVVETQYDSIGVDTPEDLERVRRRLAPSVNG
jgi:3-deoxy-manno-octulosonate cytidylyltransferase (CMP-KDO synthetase)